VQSFRFQRGHRLLHRRHFLYLQRRGRRADARHLFLFFVPQRHRTRRFGFTVSRKVGGAVVRNRVRRRLREVVRLHMGHFANGCSFVLVAKPSAATADYQALQADVLSLADQALYNPPKGVRS
jgi:ribonuclease P protein component